MHCTAGPPPRGSIVHNGPKLPVTGGEQLTIPLVMHKLYYILCLFNLFFLGTSGCQEQTGWQPGKTGDHFFFRGFPGLAARGTNPTFLLLRNNLIQNHTPKVL